MGKKRRLVLYSGGQEKRNWLLHEEVVALGAARSTLRMTYIPFCSAGHKPFFRRFERRYRPYGATHFDCLPVDDPTLCSQTELEHRILRSDVIYLSGGNTFYFLQHLRRRRTIGLLRRFVAKGGVLAGLSAGAILMTPNIGLAGYPSFDRDENEAGIRDLRALRLVDFEFFPHYRESARYREAMRQYSKRSKHPVYACKDGSGIVVHEDRFTAYGDVFLFSGGKELKIGA